MPPAPKLTGPTGAPPGGVEVDVDDPSRRLAPAGLQWLAAYAAQAIGLLAQHGEVRVRVVGDTEMAAAHERYQGVSGTTDVLTFDLADHGASQPSALVLDTDILVCFDEAVRQGGLRGHPPERELLLYIVHGVLHCMGHDDHDPVAAAAMHSIEDRVLESLGVGATYARGELGGLP